MAEGDDGFVGYVPTATDPGVAIVIATVVFCLLSNAILPCLVTLGRRYEKRRMAFLEARDDGRAEQKDESGGRDAGQNEQSAIEDGVSVSLSSYHRGAVSPKKSKMTKVRNLLDQVVIPPYPDDDIGSSTGRAKAMSTVSEAVSRVSHSSARSNITNPRIFDAPAKRTRGYARQRRALMDRGRMLEDTRQESDADRLGGGDIGMSQTRYPRTTASDSAGGVRTRMDDTAGLDRRDVASEIPRGRSEVASRVSSSSSIHVRGRHGRRGAKRNLRSGSPEPSVMSRLDEHVISPMDAADAFDPGRPEQVAMAGDSELDLCCGKHAWWRPAMVCRGLDTLISYGEWDREMKRIISISLSLSVEGFLEGLFEVLTVAVIARFIGTDAVAAYTIVDLILGLPTEFFGGLQGAVGVLCPQAYGSGNDRLTGQYVQIGAVLFTVCMIPTAILGVVFCADIMKLLGFDDETAQIAEDFAPWFFGGLTLEGISDCYHELLEVVGHEKYCLLIGAAENAVGFAIVLTACLLRDDVTLTDVGIIQFLTTVLFTAFSVSFVVWRKWMTKHHGGVFFSFALCNGRAVRNVVNTALPLSIGFLLQYGEWEVLTIFAAYMGAAEVAAWGILGTLWEAFEAMTEGIADGGEIRVGYHLGASRPAKAKKAGYKAVIFGVFVACTFTSVIFILGENIAVWFSSDLALQHIIADLIPLLGIGNISMTAGSVSWGLVGAQGRYRLANIVQFVSTCCVTLPLAALFTFALGFNLMGCTSAVVIGDSVTNTALLYIMIRSDWERLSKIIVQMHDEAVASVSSDLA